jgi:hypothetical protein
MGFIIKSKANWEPGGNRANGGLVSSSSYKLGLLGSSLRSWGLILGGARARGVRGGYLAGSSFIYNRF